MPTIDNPFSDEKSAYRIFQEAMEGPEDFALDSLVILVKAHAGYSLYAYILDTR